MNQDQIKQELQVAENIVDRHRATYLEADAKAKRLRNLLLAPIPDYGDLMTLKEFEGEVGNGFCDDDGSGDYATATHVSNIDVNIYNINHNLLINEAEGPEVYTHIVWYNK